MKVEDNPFECEIHGFWAVDKIELCKKFSRGHIDVLRHHGLTNFPSNSIDWFDDKDTYVVLALKNNIPLAGMRMQRLTSSHMGSIEGALVKYDLEVTKRFNDMLIDNPFEISALWNSKSVSGMKLSAIISRLGLVLAPTFGWQISVCLMAKYVFHLPTSLGYEIIRDIGNNGIFNYPTEDFQAAVWRNSNIIELTNCGEIEKNRILSLRDNLNQKSLELNNKLLIQYDLHI
jgi:hypothetical protein